jgi:hypothetical protein
MIFWTAQILGIVAIALNLTAMWMKDKRKMSLFIAFAGIFFVLNLGLLGGISGAIICLIGSIQAFADYFIRKKNKDGLPKWATVIFGIVSAAIAVFAVTSWFDILPIVSAILGVLVVGVKKGQQSRVIFMINSSIWGIYSLLVSAYTGALGDLAQIVITMIAFINYANKAKIKEKNRPDNQVPRRNGKK